MLALLLGAIWMPLVAPDANPLNERMDLPPGSAADPGGDAYTYIRAWLAVGELRQDLRIRLQCCAYCRSHD